MEARPRHLAQLGRLRMGVDRLDEELEAGRLDEGTGGRGWEEGAAADGELDLDGLVVAVGFEAGEDELHPALVNESFPLLMHTCRESKGGPREGSQRCAAGLQRCAVWAFSGKGIAERRQGHGGEAAAGWGVPKRFAPQRW